MVIYENAQKKLEYKKGSNGDSAFYLTREGSVYKINHVNNAVAHVIRNLNGDKRIVALGKLAIIATIKKVRG